MFELTFGFMVAVSMYLILEPPLHRKVLGVVVLSTVINLMLLFAGRLKERTAYNVPAFIGGHHFTSGLSNPLPQALVLTAIVIGFGLLVLLCVLIRVVKKHDH